MAAQPAGVGLETVHLLPWGFPNPVGRPPPARPSRPTLGWRPICGGSFSVAEDLSPDLLSLILKRIVGVSVACT